MASRGFSRSRSRPTTWQSGLVYADYTDRAGDTRVVEYRRSASNALTVDPASARVVLRVDQPFSNHNGGLLMFGPDGLLYVGLGDGGPDGDPDRRGQDLGTLLGKILRIDPQPSGGRPYSVPASNPFLDRPGAQPEIYSYGLRNPWRFSFDRRTGALAIGDVGETQWEEIDLVPHGAGRGANFGWSAFEGFARFNDDQTAPNAIPPVLVYPHDEGCSVTVATSSATPRSHRSTAATSTATSAPGICGASRPCRVAARRTTGRSA